MKTLKEEKPHNKQTRYLQSPYRSSDDSAGVPYHSTCDRSKTDQQTNVPL